MMFWVFLLCLFALVLIVWRRKRCGNAAPAMGRCRSLPHAELMPAIKQMLGEGRAVTLRVRGFSMRPLLEDGRDRVVISPVHPARVGVGDVVLAEVAAHIHVLHRVVSRDGDLLTLRGDGNVYGTEQCSDSKVIGRVSAFYLGVSSKPLLVTSYKWRMYSRLWPASPFLRHCFLAFHRRIVLRACR